MSAVDHGDDLVSAAVRRFQIAFTWHCDCGGSDCTKPRLAAADDVRVVACTLLGAIATSSKFLEERDPASAQAVLAAALEQGRGALDRLLARASASLELDVEALCRLVVTDDGGVVMPVLEAEIARELVETAPDMRCMPDVRCHDDDPFRAET